jgi:hypothetical protein
LPGCACTAPPPAAAAAGTCSAPIHITSVDVDTVAVAVSEIDPCATVPLLSAVSSDATAPDEVSDRSVNPAGGVHVEPLRSPNAVSIQSVSCVVTIVGETCAVPPPVASNAAALASNGVAGSTPV